MQPLSKTAILIFSTACAVLLALAVTTAALLGDRLPLGDYRPLAVVAGTLLLFLASATAAQRLLHATLPLPLGPTPAAGRGRLSYELHVLSHLVIFYPVLLPGMLPVPLQNLMFTLLGARMGENSYSAGMLFDEPLIEVGANCILGRNSMVIPHVIEGARLEHHPVRIGDNVTVGAGAVIMAGVTIGDGAVVAAGSVVPKFTEIGAGEFWEGLPARQLTLADLMARRAAAAERPAAARKLA